MRYALKVAYDGSQYHGWQSQSPAIPTVQDQLEAALSQIAAAPVRVSCAGRTDTGVHALGQVVHFDSDSDRSVRDWIRGGNALMPDDISITDGLEVDMGFDARHSAVSRRYLYVIHNHRRRHALMTPNLTREHRPLDAECMHTAAQSILGENDFSSFRAATCQSRTPMRNVQSVRVTRHSSLVVVDISANAFLHHMVRNIVGSLLEIGAGAQSANWMAELLSARDRNLAAKTAPPNGLYLLSVGYPADVGVDFEPDLPHFFDLLAT